MKKSVLRSLSDKDQALLRETRPGELKELDEEELLALHTRVRRARTKHLKNYRRSAADRVVRTGSRGGARPMNQKHRDRTEALEDALARVSRRVAKVARDSATALRDERMAVARGSGGAPDKSSGKGRVAPPADRNDDRRDTSPARRKRVASSAAAGARRQARKDNR